MGYCKKWADVSVTPRERGDAGMSSAKDLIAKTHVLTTAGHLPQARKFVLAKVDAIELMLGVSDTTLDRLCGNYNGFTPRLRAGAEIGLERLTLYEAWLDEQIGRQMAQAAKRARSGRRKEDQGPKGSPDMAASD